MKKIVASLLVAVVLLFAFKYPYKTNLTGSYEIRLDDAKSDRILDAEETEWLLSYLKDAKVQRRIFFSHSPDGHPLTEDNHRYISVFTNDDTHARVYMIVVLFDTNKVFVEEFKEGGVYKELIFSDNEKEAFMTCIRSL